MRDLGWAVTGVELDEPAAREAMQRGIDVFHGTLHEANLPADSFDVITLIQVIEHVPDPLRTVTECARLLKPGGQLVVITPNANSASHRVFGPYWRGLEPPRHLYILSPSSIRSLLQAAGLVSVKVGPQVASSVIRESLGLWLARWGKRDARLLAATSPLRVAALLIGSLELLLSLLTPSIADCLGATARKLSSGASPGQAPGQARRTQ
jgi:SAM-dependent methyltransferase